MAVPEEVWNWSKFDLFTLSNLSAMIGDEFFDGDIKEKFFNITTRYAELKKARKTFKDLANRDKLVEALNTSIRNTLLPRWLNRWIPIWEYTRSFKYPYSLLQVDGILSQTRSAGQPPDLIKMQSKRDFISTVSEAPVPLTGTQESMINAALVILDKQLDPSIFTGLDTKARVTISKSACWEHTQQEGGTVQAISEIVHLGAHGMKVPKRDLFSGKVEEELALSDTNSGTFIFWACLDEVLKLTPEELRQVALVMISEPGKARTVTKGRAALKVVLDTVSKICSWPLTKVESSKSGMSRSHHAWNAFKKSFTDEGKDFVFEPESTSWETAADGRKYVKTTYRDLYASSTDYSNATDNLDHSVARMISGYWMKKCGIPPILQMIVNGICYEPRAVVFEANGPMASIGSEWKGESPFKNPRSVTLRRGVLMGDPLTKPVLHLVNILVRTVGASYTDEYFLTNMFKYESQLVSEVIKPMMQEEQSLEQKITAKLSSIDEEAKSEDSSVPFASTAAQVIALGKLLKEEITNDTVKLTTEREVKNHLTSLENTRGFKVTIGGLLGRPKVELDYKQLFQTGGSSLVTEQQVRARGINRSIAFSFQTKEFEERKRLALLSESRLRAADVLPIKTLQVVRAPAISPAPSKAPMPKISGKMVKSKEEDTPTCTLSMSAIWNKVDKFSLRSHM
jgi:hypothetical protein